MIGRMTIGVTDISDGELIEEVLDNFSSYRELRNTFALYNTGAILVEYDSERSAEEIEKNVKAVPGVTWTQYHGSD